MIQSQTIVEIVDNSGITKIKCLKILGGTLKRCGFNGSLLCASVSQLRKRNKKISFKKGDLVFVLVVYTRFGVLREDGERLFFFKNSAVVVDKQIKPLATRILSPLGSEFRKKKYAKLLGLASYLI